MVMIRRVGGCFTLMGLALAGCGNGHQYPAGSRHCNPPPIPRVGTSGFVTATALPGVSGYRVDFQSRQWQASHVEGYPSALVGRAVVVSAVPYPALQVIPNSGHRVTLPLLVLGCG